VHPEPRESGEPRVDVTELSRVDAGLQDRFDLPLVFTTTQVEPLSAFARESVELVQDHPRMIGVAVDHVQQFVAEHGQLSRR
jgi:hypothetical protein